MNLEHVSVEERPAPTSFLGISSLSKPLISPLLAVSQAAFEERHELQRKQEIIARALERIIARGLWGLEQVKAYLVELYRRNCRPNTLRTHAVTIASFLVYLKGSGRDGLEAIDREAIGGFVEHQQDLGLTPSTISVRLRGLYSFLKFVVGRGELSAEVLARKLRIKLPQSLPRAIDPQAVRQMLGVIDHVRDRAIVLVLLRTGMRIGELLDRSFRDK
jgi:site-specific recombinase XerC